MQKHLMSINFMVKNSNKLDGEELYLNTIKTIDNKSVTEQVKV